MVHFAFFAMIATALAFTANTLQAQSAEPIAMPLAVRRAEKKFSEEAASLQLLCDAGKAALDKNCAEAIAKERVKLIEVLETAKTEAAKTVNLPLANAIQERIDAVRKQEAEASPRRLIDGKWRCTIHANNSREYQFANGKVTYKATDHPGGSGAYEISNDVYVVRTSPDKFQHWTPLANGRMLVSFFLNSGRLEAYAIASRL